MHMSSTVDITIIADNGGGITLQLTADNGKRYQHYYDGYDGFKQLAEDLAVAETFSDWDGNEAQDEDGNEQWLVPTDNQIRNGGYKVFDYEDILALARKKDREDISWQNVYALVMAVALG